MYRRKPIYQFNDVAAVELADIPIHSTISVIDYNGSPRQFIKVAHSEDGTTIADALISGAVIDSYYSATQEALRGTVGNISSPLLDLPLKNSLAMKAGVGSVVFTGDAGRTYIDRYGVMQTTIEDEPRFEKGGLLIEGASTNIHLYSEDSANYPQKGSTVNTVDDTESINNITFTTVTTTSDDVYSVIISQSDAIDLVPGESITLSVFVDITNNIDSELKITTFDDNDDITTTYIPKDCTNIRIGQYHKVVVKEVSTNIRRVEVTYTTESDRTDVYMSLELFTDDGLKFAGDESESFRLQCIQTEKLPFASSYIPTTDSAVTRNAEYCEVSLKNNISCGEELSISYSFDILGMITDYQRPFTFVLDDDDVALCYITKADMSLAYDDDASTSLVSTGFVCEPYVVTDVLITIGGGVTDMYINNIHNNGQVTDSQRYSGSPYLMIGTGDRSVTNRHLFGHIKNFSIFDFKLNSVEANLL